MDYLNLNFFVDHGIFAVLGKSLKGRKNKNDCGKFYEQHMSIVNRMGQATGHGCEQCKKIK